MSVRAGALPPELAGFVGRRRELAEVRRLLERSRLVTLTGTGGVGKTRLAVRAAASMERTFPDGTWFVPLAELTDPALLASTVVAAVGLPDRLAGQWAELADFLQDKQALLVLDNCEHLVDACIALVGKVLSVTRGVRILVTSRQILRAEGEYVVTVPPLSVPPAVRGLPGESVTLFAERAAAVQPGFELNADNREVVFQICRRLEGIPLAIELAAVRVRVLTPQQILERLDSSLRLLVTGSSIALPRQRTLMATIGWSYELCTLEEQALWRTVSVFPGGFDLDAAEAACTDDTIARDSVLDLIAALVDKSVLIRRNGTYGRTAWYAMLETVREYGVLRLTESGEAERVHLRQIEYYTGLTRRYYEEYFGPGQRDWTERLRRQHANLRAVLDYCVENRRYVRYATEMAAALSNYWYAADCMSEGYYRLTTILALDTESSRVRGHALRLATFLAPQVPKAGDGWKPAAEEMLAELAVLAEAFDDDVLHAGFASSTGFVRMASGDIAGAQTMFERALAGYRRAPAARQMEVFSMLLVLTSMAFFREEEGTGADLAAEALALAESHQAEVQMMNAMSWVAAHAWRRGDYRHATALLCKAIGYRWAPALLHATSTAVLAWCADATGQHERAARLLGITRMLLRKSGWEFSKAHPYQVFNEECAERIRAAVGAAAFTTAFDAGAALEFDEAISFALGGKPAKPATAARRDGQGTLTRRERQVAELVAEGLANKQIADRLVIARRTAEGHVERVLTKLGLTSRTQIVAWVIDQREPQDPSS